MTGPIGFIVGDGCCKSGLWWTINSFRQFGRSKFQGYKKSKSTTDIINKFKIVEEEKDESLFFLEMIVEFNKDKREKVAIIYKEGREIFEDNRCLIKNALK